MILAASAALAVAVAIAVGAAEAEEEAEQVEEAGTFGGLTVVRLGASRRISRRSRSA